jgi:crotonobetainyl-CoA:carnitine CoA-transferase CaiB-like acyl-CoA transferase
MQYVAEGVSPGPAGNRDLQWAPHGVYATGEDEWLTISCPDDASWQALARLIDTDTGTGLAADARLADAAGRKRHEGELDDAVARWVAGRDRWQLTGRLQASGVAAVPSLSPLQLWQGNEQLEAIGMLERPDHPVTGRHVVPGIPWRLANGPNGLRRPAPLLGQHNDEVLTELGFTPGEIAALAASGAVRAGAAVAATGAAG